MLTAPLVAALLLAATASGAPDGPAAGASDGRIELKDLESKLVKVGEPRVTTVDVLYDRAQGPSTRARINIVLANQGEVGYWLVARMTHPDAPSNGRTGTVYLAPGENTEFESSPDSLVTDTDYLFDILAFADSAQTDTLEAHFARFRLNAAIPTSVHHRNALAGDVPEARSLPKTYHGVTLRERFGMKGYLVSDASRPGTLAITDDGLEFAAKGRAFRCAASQLRSVSATTVGPESRRCVIVEYDEGGTLKRVGIQASAAGDGLLLPIQTSIETLLQHTRTGKE